MIQKRRRTVSVLRYVDPADDRRITITVRLGTVKALIAWAEETGGARAAIPAYDELIQRLLAGQVQRFPRRRGDQ